MTDVVNTANFIRSRELNHRQFKAFADGIRNEHGDIGYCSEVRRASLETLGIHTAGATVTLESTYVLIIYKHSKCCVYIDLLCFNYLSTF